MANYYGRTRQAYGIGQSLQGIFPSPIVTAGLNPTVNDHGEPGQIWVNTTAGTFYVLVSDAAGVATWRLNSTATGAISGSSLTITPGPTSITGTLALPSFTAGVMQTNALGVVSSTKGTNGQVLIGSTAGVPAWATLTGGAGITVTGGANSITISQTSSGMTWSSEAANFTAAVDNGYRCTAALTCTLPAAPTLGQTVALAQDAAAGTIIQINAGAGDVIYMDGVQCRAAGTGFKTANTSDGSGTVDQIGCYIEVMALSASAWTVVSKNGNWVAN